MRLILRALPGFLLLALILASRPVAAQEAPLTLDQYEQLVREAYAAASRADRIGLDEVAARLTTIRDVTLPDGAVLPVDNGWLAEELAIEPPAYRLIAARLGAVLDALGQPAAPRDPDALAKLDAVFSRPPFQSREAPSAWNHFWTAVGNAIESFFDWLFRNLPAGGGQAGAPTPWGRLSPLGWTFLIAGLLLVLGLVIYAARGVRRALARDAQVREQVAADEADLSASVAIDRAGEAARAGDYRSAARYLYLSSLLWLDERKLLRYERSLTNREVLDRSRDQPALHQRLTPVVNTFERVWYGKRPLDEAGYRQYEQQVRALRDEETSV